MLHEALAVHCQSVLPSGGQAPVRLPRGWVSTWEHPYVLHVDMTRFCEHVHPPASPAMPHALCERDDRQVMSGVGED